MGIIRNLHKHWESPVPIYVGIYNQYIYYIWTETIQKIFYCKKHKNRNTIFDVLEMDVLANILLTFETHIAAEKKNKNL